MSNIIAAADQGQQIHVASAWVLLLPWLILAVMLLYVLKCFRRGKIVGPMRTAEHERAGLFVLLFLASLLGGLLAAMIAAPLIRDPAWRSFAVGGVFNLAGALVLVMLNHRLRGDDGGRLGMRVGQIPRGLWQGAIGLVVLLPLVMVCGQVIEEVARWWNWALPTHEVLREMRSTDSWTEVVGLWVVAVVLAPIFEEMMFRGMMQSFLVKVLDRNQSRGSLQVGEEVWADHSVAALAGGRAIAARWGAIGITSLAFAAVHGEWLWMAPLFLLSAGLGYAYERTGNLWVSIIMHGLFNALQITIFMTAA
ncbi:MAG: CPBP family intramembrane metalloprotease [Phycisphaerales bacterium]|nr:CPBP family intramembrane metalloprotease [Phycisphaerales bacterium]